MISRRPTEASTESSGELAPARPVDADDSQANARPRGVGATWRREMAAAITDPAELLSMLELPAEPVEAARRAAKLFPFRVPRGFVRRMRTGDIDDPLLRQVLPLDAEVEETPGFGADPLGEAHVSPVPGMLHKYRGRVLLVATSACAVHCRYCFRREFPYDDHRPGWSGWHAALDYVAGKPEIDEVILSGGDPLSAGDRRLAELARSIEAIAHVDRLRIHTRAPIVLPERVDAACLDWLGRGRLSKVMVLHANHANEIDDSVADALVKLRSVGVRLFNQAVLLRGVNDSVAALEGLSRRLFEVDVQPYYLYLLDRVRGAAHFDVPEAEARRLAWRLAERLPGYLVPRLVREMPGEPAKVPIPIGPLASPLTRSSVRLPQSS